MERSQAIALPQDHGPRGCAGSAPAPGPAPHCSQYSPQYGTFQPPAARTALPKAASPTQGCPIPSSRGHRHGADIARPLGTLRHHHCARSHEPMDSTGKAALIQLCPAPAPPQQLSTSKPQGSAGLGSAWERQEKAARRLSPSQVSWCASGTGTLRLDFGEMLNIWSPALQGSLCAAGKLSAIKQHLFLRASRRGGGKGRREGNHPRRRRNRGHFSALSRVFHAMQGAGSSLQPRPRPC